MIVCPKCGHENDDQAMNCADCGINLEWALENLAEVAQMRTPVAVPGDAANEKADRKRTQMSPAAKRRDFLIGFFGWFVLNGLVWLLVAVVGQEGDFHDPLNYGEGLVNLCVLPLNVLALIILAFWRRWISLGMLSAVALNLFIALILGLTEYGTCAVPFFAGLAR